MFTWLSKAHGFALYYYTTWLAYKKKSRHFFIQSEIEPILARSHTFFRASRQLHVFTPSLIGSLLTALFASFVIGQSL